MLLTLHQITVLLKMKTSSENTIKLRKAINSLGLKSSPSDNGSAEAWPMDAVLAHKDAIIKGMQTPITNSKPVELPFDADEFKADMDQRIATIIADELEEVREVVPKLIPANQALFKKAEELCGKQSTMDAMLHSAFATQNKRLDHIESMLAGVMKRLDELKKPATVTPIVAPVEAVKVVEEKVSPLIRTQSGGATVDAKSASDGKGETGNAGGEGAGRNGSGSNPRGVRLDGKGKNAEVSARKASVAIIGVIPTQIAWIEKEYGNCFKLTCIQPGDKTPVLTSYDAIFILRGRIGGAVIKTLKAQRAVAPTEIGSGEQKIRDALTAFFVQYSDAQKAA